MLFYQLTYSCCSADGSNRYDRRQWIEFGFEHYQGAVIGVIFHDEDRVVVDVAIEHTMKASLRRKVAAFFRRFDLCIEYEGSTERTFQQFLQDLDRSGISNDLWQEALTLEDWRAFRRHSSSEVLIGHSYTKRCAENFCRTHIGTEELKSEVQRIYDDHRPKDFVAHPVQYVLPIDEESVCREWEELLLGALLRTNRLLGKRVFRLCASGAAWADFRWEQVRELYRLQGGATIIIRISHARWLTESGKNEDENWEQLAHLIQAHRHEVLTILEIPRDDKKIQDKVRELGQHVSLICLKESSVSTEEAKRYLDQRAETDGFVPAIALPKRKEFFPSELVSIYREWYDSHLRSNVYSAYRSAVKNPDEDIQPNQGWEELESMPGLKEAKRRIREIVDYFSWRELVQTDGKKETDRPSMHMVFAGNPGTAKTTTARLLAKIFRERGILSQGKLIEVGRSDLVDQYVGGTALKVKRAFQRAEGSVLLIDEAYSLIDRQRNSFGDEAINTIVQEMERRRDDLVVILAGYPDRMRDFLGTNPGLRSRISFHIDFPDYNVQELMDIFRHFLKQNDMEIAPGIEDQIRNGFTHAASVKDFGNGRFVRNFFDRANMLHAGRIMRQDRETWETGALYTLDAQDLPGHILSETTTHRQLGFSI